MFLYLHIKLALYYTKNDKINNLNFNIFLLKMILNNKKYQNQLREKPQKNGKRFIF